MKIFTNRVYKIGVIESNGNVMFAVGRHLMTKTTSGQILKVSQSRITCKRLKLQIDEMRQCNTNKKHPGLSIVHIRFTLKLHLAAKTAYGSSYDEDDESHRH
jgi:hypothetical protein